MVDTEGVVLENREIVPGYHLVTIRLAEPFSAVKPGQFAMIRVGSGQVFLRRPFSIYDYGKGRLSILFRITGKGTGLLGMVKKREVIKVLGPLGNGFSPLPGSQHLLIAGGIGIAGLNLLRKHLGARAKLFFGCSTKAEMYLLERMEENCLVSTVDGSFGCRGTVVDLLSQHLAGIERTASIYACGPLPMYLSLRSLLEKDRLPCQVLLEERMACGLGLCFGCVVKTIDEEEPYKRVCKEGPAFDLWQISQ